jgi:hypothetical protein
MRLQHEEVSLSLPTSRFTSRCPKDPGDLISALRSPSRFSAERPLSSFFPTKIPPMLLRSPLAHPFYLPAMGGLYSKAFSVSPMFVDGTNILNALSDLPFLARLMKSKYVKIERC